MVTRFEFHKYLAQILKLFWQFHAILIVVGLAQSNCTVCTVGTRTNPFLYRMYEGCIWKNAFDKTTCSIQPRTLSTGILAKS